MCKFCGNYENVCLACGSIQHPDWNELQGFGCERRSIKHIVGTSDSENFVWIMMYRGNVVKVGIGSLKKLYNETLPNPRYVKFDSCFIYYVTDEYKRNELGTLLCGLYSDNIVNRTGWKNAVYCTRNDLLLPHGDNPSCIEVKYGDPDFFIGDTSYWDIRRLYGYGIRRRKLCI